jgi:hypothetical protein
MHLAGELGDTAGILIRSVRLRDLADPAHLAVQRLEPGPGRAIWLGYGMRARWAWY